MTNEIDPWDNPLHTTPLSLHLRIIHANSNDILHECNVLVTKHNISKSLREVILHTLRHEMRLDLDDVAELLLGVFECSKESAHSKLLSEQQMQSGPVDVTNDSMNGFTRNLLVKLPSEPMLRIARMMRQMHDDGEFEAQMRQLLEGMGSLSMK